jgi:exodeoxyribonuclease VII small subunit
MVNSNTSFEEALQQLKLNTEELKADDISLQNAVKLFNDSVNLAKLCSAKITEAEIKINEIMSTWNVDTIVDSGKDTDNDDDLPF